jgi:hypothetical protein
MQSGSWKVHVFGIRVEDGQKKATRGHSVLSGSTQVHVFEISVEDGQKNLKHIVMHTVCINTH